MGNSSLRGRELACEYYPFFSRFRQVTMFESVPPAGLMLVRSRRFEDDCAVFSKV